MPYAGCAVELYFDPVRTEKIKSLWDAIRLQCGGREGGVNPHITLALIENEKPERLRALTAEFARRSHGQSITLSAIGIFPTAEGAIYLAPVVTSELLELHRAFHVELGANGLTSHRYYRPGNWIPHCTVGIGLSSQALACAVDLCVRSEAFLTGSLVEMALIELPDVREVYRVPMGEADVAT
jgi:hypothetical protein